MTGEAGAGLHPSLLDSSAARSEIEAAVLEERTRIAREIHDTLAQTFSGILLELGVAQRLQSTRPEDAWAIVDHVRELAQTGLTEARRSVWALQPSAEQDSDLVGALRRIVRPISVDESVQTELQIHGTPRPLPADVGRNLLRIAQEALSNALRHARAQIIWIDVTYEPERILLRIQDDGRGIWPMHEGGGGFGLISMRQRAERLGGEMVIESRPGRGTEIAVDVPLASTE